MPLPDIDPASIALGEIPAALTMLASLQITLAARLVTAPAQPEAAPEDDDKWLTAQEVALALRKSVKWVYRRAARLPFARRLDNRSWVFSKKGLERWLGRQRG